ncbi:Anaphase-promoting complex subunit 8 [Cryptotrichosporon argae]
MQSKALSPAERVQLAHDLRRSIRELTDRGLAVSAKWSAELLASLPAEHRSVPQLPFSPPPQTASLHPALPSSPPALGPRPSVDFLPPNPYYGDMALDPVAGPSRARTKYGVELEAEDDILDEDTWSLARCYFDIKEYERTAYTLREARSGRARFLRYYSLYLSADRKAQSSLPHFLDSKEERAALFPVLSQLLAELKTDTDPYITYLRGILYMRLEQRNAAADCFVTSVKDRPYNWSCWTQLAQVIKSADMFMDVKEQLPNSIMLSFFAITAMLDLHTATDVIVKVIADLTEVFPTNVHLKAQTALVLYHMRDFEKAEAQFDMVQAADPFRMEDVDIYSNMLYVMDKRAKLGKLAHEYAAIDANRPEVCCLIGNYYSSRGDHTKAITYFKRALTLNREYLPAWTLMGHEFVELKNSHAAIEAYRKAVEVNAKDYRAWYGLGQVYELLDQPTYAIEYYNHATALRPYDCRMWTALATVYETQGRLAEAVAAHARALLGADRQQSPAILVKLASLYTALARGHGQGHGHEPGAAAGTAHADWAAEAAECHRKVLALGERTGTATPEMAPSYVAVAEWEMRAVLAEQAGESGAGAGDGDWALAAQYLDKVAQSNAPLRERAHDLLKLLRMKEAAAAR